MQQLLVDDEQCWTVGSSQYRDDQFPRKTGEIASARSHMNVSVDLPFTSAIIRRVSVPVRDVPWSRAHSASFVFYVLADNTVHQSGNAPPRTTSTILPYSTLFFVDALKFSQILSLSHTHTLSLLLSLSLSILFSARCFNFSTKLFPRDTSNGGDRLEEVNPASTHDERNSKAPRMLIAWLHPHVITARWCIFLFSHACTAASTRSIDFSRSSFFASYRRPR